MTARGDANGTSRRGGVAGRGAGALAAVVLLLAACTEPPPTAGPTPPPEETPDSAPAGVDVAVVLPSSDDEAALPMLEVEEQLAELADEQVGDVAAIRPVTVDDAEFVPDTAAFLADDGADLICVFGSSGVRTVLALADRFPATRFCALGQTRDGLPANVDVFEIDHEQLGHLLGVGVGELAGDRPTGIVLDDDDEEPSSRRAGARAALVAASVAVDTTVEGAAAAVDAVEAAAAVDEELAVVLVDSPIPGVVDALAGVVDVWVGRAGLATATPPAVGWSIRADVVVADALDRLITGEEPDAAEGAGSAVGAFDFTYADAVPERVREAIEAASREFARGTRDPLSPALDRDGSRAADVALR